MHLKHEPILLNNNYLSPLPLTGETARDMENGIDIGVEKDLNHDLEMVYRQDEDGKDVLKFFKIYSFASGIVNLVLEEPIGANKS